LTTILDDTTNLANSVVGGPLACLPRGLDACIDQAKAPLHLLGFVKDFAWCTADVGSGCEGLNNDFDCAHGFTSECNAHLSFFTVSLLAGGAGGGEAAASRAAAAGSSSGAAARLAKAAGCSFAAATPVLMTDGDTKPIEQVKVGDWVKSSDPMNGQVVDERVTAVHQRVERALRPEAVADRDILQKIEKAERPASLWRRDTGRARPPIRRKSAGYRSAD
jgi:hypothetical protein